MKKLIYSIIGIMVFMFVGCQDILDLKPQQSLDPSQALNSSQGVKQVLIGAYSDMHNGPLTTGVSTFAGMYYYLPDLLGGGSEIQYIGTQPPGLDINNRAMTTTNAYSRNAWMNAYTVINDVNTVLAHLDVVDQADRDKVEGQAKFIRAVMYFNLVRMFAKDYSDGDPSQNLGVPLKLKPTKTIGKEQKLGRSTVQKVYNQIIKDLKDAESLLNVQPPSYIYASKYAASAYLARVYLQMRKYVKARNEANKIIESHNYSLVKNYADEFNQPKNTSEDIFAIQVTDQTFNGLHAVYASGSQGGSPSFVAVVTQDHLDLYNPNDERLKLFYKGSDGNWYVGKYKNQFANVPVVRLAEMYLIRAECNERLGTTLGAKPYEDINKIRTRAGLSPVSSVTLQDILKQRKLELAFEGHFLWDIKRTHGSVEGVPWDSPKLVFPIPQRELDVNPNLTQNPGYGG